jgi:hypothetical protein
VTPATWIFLILYIEYQSEGDIGRVTIGKKNHPAVINYEVALQKTGSTKNRVRE